MFDNSLSQPKLSAQGKVRSANIAHSRALRGSKAWMRRKLHG
jgi:hypothetical protein